MIDHFTMRTHGVNQAFRFLKGIWLHWKSLQPDFVSRKTPNLHHTCASCSDLPSYISAMQISFLVQVSYSVVLIIDGNSEIGVHVKSNLCSICLRHFFKPRAVIETIFFSKKKPVFLHLFATCSGLPSNMFHDRTWINKDNTKRFQWFELNC